MISLKKKTLVILPHLDDEFAIFPILKLLHKNILSDLKIIYCSERNDKKKQILKRRKNNIKSLSFFKIKPESIIYLNDYFEVIDNLLINSYKNIFKFIENLCLNNFYSQIITLNLEGGHPDHDTVALIVDKIGKKLNMNAYFFPAYNYRNTLFIPYSVLRPLKSQEDYSIKINLNYFFWIDLLRIALIYQTERKAFIKLLPFLIYKSLFSNKIEFFDHISLSYLEWEKSLSLRRYKLEFKDIENLLDKLD